MSEAKTGVGLNTPNFSNDNQANKADIQEIINEVVTRFKLGQVTISSGDTHVKTLEEAIIGVAGNLLVEILNPSGNAQMRLNLDATGVASGYGPLANGLGGWAWGAPPGSGVAPLDITITAGEALAERDVVYRDSADGEWYKLDIDADPIKCSDARAVVNELGGISNGATGTVRILGEVSGYAGLTPMQPVFASATAGGVTQTRPSPTLAGAQVAIIEIGIAVSATNILVNTMARPCSFQKRASLADDATLTLKHFADALGRGRRYRAFLGGTVAGTTHTSYADSNQDVHVRLRGATGAGATLDVNESGDSLGIGDSGGTETRIAMSFIPTSGILTTIKFTLIANDGSPTGGISWEVRNNNAGQPGSTVLASGGPVAVTPSAENTINVTNGPLLDGSTTYHLVLYTQAQANNTSYRWQCSSGAGSYANGNVTFSTNGGSSWSNSTADAEFSIVTAASTQKDKLAQSFQITGTQTVDKVRLWLKKVGAPTGTMTLRIETNNAGSPSGTLADANATITVAESGLTTSYAWTDFDFATNFSLSGSTTYWIVLSTNRSASNVNYVDWGSDGSSPAYASGEMKYEASSSYSAETKDAVFEVVGPATAFDSPLMISSWASGAGEVEVVAGDGSAASQDTQTTLKNIKGVTSDITLVVELD